MNWLRAPAKINLSLHVVGRRADGLHRIESLVAFAEQSDWLGYLPGPRLSCQVEGPNGPQTGPLEDNLVLVAARRLAERVPSLVLGHFHLIKRLPAAAGVGGGSADAAAALRVLAAANGLSLEDERVRTAAADTGADVPVCLFSRARMMAGVGDRLGPLVALPKVYAVLVNPRIVVLTRHVFEAFRTVAEPRLQPIERPTADGPATLDSVVSCGNDLQAAAVRVAPAIEAVLETLSRLPGAIAARMTGSGATCFALFDRRAEAVAAQQMIVADQPQWWVKVTGFR